MPTDTYFYRKLYGCQEKFAGILIIQFAYLFNTGDPIRDEITSAILQLQEADEILALKNKWWRTGICTTEDGQKEDANELGLENIGGIFLVLIAGLLLGILVAFGEFVWKSRENAKTDRVRLDED